MRFPEHDISCAWRPAKVSEVDDGKRNGLDNVECAGPEAIAKQDVLEIDVAHAVPLVVDKFG